MLLLTKPFQSAGGNQNSVNEKTRTSRGPNTKLGIEMPSIATTMLAESSHEFCFKAANAPIVIPTIRASRYEVTPSAADTGNARKSIWLTDWPSYFSEVPKSKRAIFFKTFPYWTYHGLSNPYFSRRLASTAGAIF